MPTEHTFKQFDMDLESIRANVLKMGGLVEEQITRSVEALTSGDLSLADEVIAHDHNVNALEVQIDEDVAHVIARRAPTASDLRMLMMVVKTITDLERIGDEAERVGRMAMHFSEGNSGASQPLVGIRHFGEHVHRVLHAALDAFARMDVEQALQVAREDEKVDEEYESILRQLMTYMMEDPRSIPRIVNVMWAARALERIGDRARNICEYLIYLVRGKDVRHISMERVEEAARHSHETKRRHGDSEQ